MSLYNHVGGTEALLHGLAEAIGNEVQGARGRDRLERRPPGLCHLARGPGAFGPADCDMDYRFTLGLDLIVTGLEARL